MIDIKRFCFEQGLSQAAFAEKIGVDQSVVSHMTRGTRKLRLDHIEKLESIYGKEVVDSYRIDEELANIINNPQARQVTATIIPTDVVEEIKAEEQVPIISRTVPTSQINVREYIDKNSDELDRIDPAKLLNNPDVAEQVTGASMLPTFAAGDVVFIKFLPDKAQMIDGKLYYFDLIDLPTMIRRVKFEGEDKVRLIAKNPAFADIVLERSRILNIGKVVGLFRSTFSDQYDEIENVRREQSGRIDRLIEQNGEALKSIHNLIDVIKGK